MRRSTWSSSLAIHLATWASVSLVLANISGRKYSAPPDENHCIICYENSNTDKSETKGFRFKVSRKHPQVLPFYFSWGLPSVLNSSYRLIRRINNQTTQVIYTWAVYVWHPRCKYPVLAGLWWIKHITWRFKPCIWVNWVISSFSMKNGLITAQHGEKKSFF